VPELGLYDYVARFYDPYTNHKAIEDGTVIPFLVGLSFFMASRKLMIIFYLGANNE
jgi:hypothetical protein